MVDEVQGGGDSESISPREVRMYEQEYKRGAQLFEKALQQYSQSDNPYQKAEFQKVMDKAMHILNETAAELNRKTLFHQNDQIEKDYTTFNQTPDDKQAAKQLEHDLEQARKSIL